MVGISIRGATLVELCLSHAPRRYSIVQLVVSSCRGSVASSTYHISSRFSTTDLDIYA